MLIVNLDSQVNIDVDNHIDIHRLMGDQKKFFQLLVGHAYVRMFMVHGVHARGA